MRPRADGSPLGRPRETGNTAPRRRCAIADHRDTVPAHTRRLPGTPSNPLGRRRPPSRTAQRLCSACLYIFKYISVSHSRRCVVCGLCSRTNEIYCRVCCYVHVRGAVVYVVQPSARASAASPVPECARKAREPSISQTPCTPPKHTARRRIPASPRGRPNTRPASARAPSPPSTSPFAAARLCVSRGVPIPLFLP